MKRNKLKETLKPLIRECIEEVLFEEGFMTQILKEIMFQKGVLSRVISEVQAATPNIQQKPIVEEKQKRQTPKMDMSHIVDRKSRERELNLEKIASAAGIENLFEGTTPIALERKPIKENSSSPGALANVDPYDPGVDISKLGF